jgi:transglutaminase-like putative cysteine protease
MLAPVTFDYAIRFRQRTEPGTAFVFILLPARTHRQQLAMEGLRVRGATVQSVFTDAASATRYLHLTARGAALEVELDARLRLLQAESGEHALPFDAAPGPMAAPESLRFLLPSRFCPSDRLAALCEREFMPIVQRHARAAAIEAWIRRHVRDEPPGTVSDDGAIPSAAEVLERGAGTPRDLAHLLIGLCRASRLPARYVTAAPFGAGLPTDRLHPWVEVLVDAAWLAFDPSRRMPRTALVRIGTGRDAADVPLVLSHGSASACRVEVSLIPVGTADAALQARDAAAEAICAATLGSLGEATRWHQEARLAARRQPAQGAQRPAGARTPKPEAHAARRGAQVLVFPPSAPPGAADAPARSRVEPV